MNYQFEENILYICTDWASRSVFNEKLKRKTGRYWGKGIRFIYYNKNFELIEEDHSDYISYIQSTNQDMELWSAINWLKIANNINLNNFKNIIIITDSKLIYDNRKCAFWYRDRPWIWRKTKYWDPVIHKKQWKELAKLINEIKKIHKVNVDFDLVKWHQKENPNDERIKYNIKADQSAVKWAQSKIRLKENNTTIRSPFFSQNKRFKEWFINFKWKEILIHICNAKYLRKKWYRYNYEAVSNDNEHFMQVGWLFYNKEVLSAKYIYLVKIKDNWSNQIESIISIHTKDKIKQSMLALWYDESIFYSWKKSKK